MNGVTSHLRQIIKDLFVTEYLLYLFSTLFPPAPEAEEQSKGQIDRTMDLSTNPDSLEIFCRVLYHVGYLGLVVVAGLVF